MSQSDELSTRPRRGAAPPQRLLLVSNRLPVKLDITDDGVRLIPSAGGLATAVGPMHEAGDGYWLGWPGNLPTDAKTRREADRQLQQRRLVPVHLEPELVDGYYSGFSNSILWPLFHYLLQRVEVNQSAWQAYEKANRRFARAVAKVYREGDLIWVHDYHLLLLPQLLRERLPNATIGFFLHTPFPSSEIFSILPWRRELMRGMLGADLVGFHVYDYLRHFRSAARRLLGVESDGDTLPVEGRTVHLGAFPIGIDPARFQTTATEHAETLRELETLQEQARGRRLILGVDRMDYTKGIPERMLGYERFLERYPSHREKVEMLQVGVPSRTGVESYQQLKRQVDEIVGRVNGRFATPDWTPIKYLYRPVPFPRLVALYRQASVALITPLRDGMNLVAREYVACQVDENPGVLVLSEFAGAAADLTEALLVNPYNPEAIARELHRALTMSRRERAWRMEQLRQRVWRNPVQRWGNRFVRALARTGGGASRLHPPRLQGPRLTELDEAWRDARSRMVILDYDGTLRSFVNRPDAAEPDRQLLSLLQRLAGLQGVELAVISGRDRSTLEHWLGGLDASLVAEHGRWLRPAGGAWEDVLQGNPPSWLDRVTDILEDFAEQTPGSLVEVKSGSVAWHYRTVNKELADRMVREVVRRLQDLHLEPAHDILRGNKVVEVRVSGVNKASALLMLLGRLPAAELLLVAGDDLTDEEMFAQLPPTAWSIHVGSRRSKARFSVAGPTELRALLRHLASRLDGRGTRG